MLNDRGFDRWSEEYDEFVKKSSVEYPFDGYYEVLEFVYNKIQSKKKARILDVGIGTGVLTHRLYKDGAVIYGVDFSREMIQISLEKMPSAIILQWDFNKGLPMELQKEKFDYIISTYAIHHLNDDKKIEFIVKLRDSLKENGKLIIADISFETAEKRNECKSKYADKWDTDEFYMAAVEILAKLKAIGVDAEYTQISACAGVLELLKS